MSFTPFGNLQNPFYQCGENYYDVTSGIIQSDTVLTGVGWIVPFPKRPGWVVSMGAGLIVDGELLVTRSDFARYGLVATRHTPYVLELVVHAGPVELAQRFWLGARDSLRSLVTVDPALPDVQSVFLLRAFRPEGEVRLSAVIDGGAGSGRQLVKVERENDECYVTPPVLWSVPGQALITGPTLNSVREHIRRGVSSNPVRPMSCDSEVFAAVVLETGNTGGVETVLDLGKSPTMAGGGAVETSDGSTVYGRPALTLAEEFESQLPRLTGDFPLHVRNGFAYDFETTRLCTLPANGIFQGPWPTWMSSMPRTVLAEGSLDMNRLAYMDDRTAKDAVHTMFRDTPDDNVPCVFASGSYNMIAADGTTCGTSPAWCIPFFNIYDLYLRTGDDTWVAGLFPHMERLIDYWLNERTDDDGWLTYKCTWEAGEDNNPRIDPLATGDNVISGYVRPVELQASMAHAGYIMARFARALGNESKAARFDSLHAEYRNRTRQLWDPSTGRFRDWDKTKECFVEVAGREDYWGADFTRQSPLSLIALLFDTADERQKEAMEAEVRRFFRSPFTIWPSWATFVLEAASAIGMSLFAGEMTCAIADRLYAATDRRTIDEFERPLPGAAPEYWPGDWLTFGGNDAYAWGAQTASFVIRHLLGIRPTEDASLLALSLSPALPEGLRAHGSVFGVENFMHRGMRMGVAYESLGGEVLRCTLSLSKGHPLTVRDHAGVTLRLETSDRHVFAVRNGRTLRIT